MSLSDLLVRSIDSRLANTAFDRFITWSTRVLPKPFVYHLGAKKYIAGKSHDDALRVAQEYNAICLRVTFDILGENFTREQQVNVKTDEYINLVHISQDSGLNADISIKLTTLGLDVGETVFNRNLELLLRQISLAGSTFQIDMENSNYTTRTFELYDRLRDEHNPILCVQANLKRTFDDIKQRPNGRFRLVKGIYLNEPEEISIKEKRQITENYKRILNEMAQNGSYIAIATHDRELIDYAFELIEKGEIKPDQFEFQMLHGPNTMVLANGRDMTEGSIQDYVLKRIILSDALRGKIDPKNLPLRIYVPFGEDWKPYCTRRFKENPAVAGDAARTRIKYLVSKIPF